MLLFKFEYLGVFAIAREHDFKPGVLTFVFALPRA